ncbi:HNH endonuclease [Ureibacillus sp. GCM10028918]|uniref:HNH endonuclease n=1 Tax=Ureibacillus sp. GCM10028918 TaxID=3273429 RepID=UPI003621F7FC
MADIKKTGSFLGKVAGTITGEPMKFLGKKLNNEYIQEIGEEVKNASTNTGTILGGIAEGTWNTASGLINKDEHKREEGISELKDTTIKTAKGVGYSIKNTYTSGKNVVQGVVYNDKEQLINGAKEIGKTVAVATIAVGVLDALDIVELDGVDDHVQADTIDNTMVDNGTSPASGIEGTTGNVEIHHLETRNDVLVGEYHPITGIEFESKVVTLPSGEAVEGVFPIFESEYTATLPQSFYLESDGTQFYTANEQLAEAINQDAELARVFTDEQLAQILANETPEGYTWHHSEVPGEMELVDEEIHAETGHIGGREIWGGGSEFR